MNPPSIAGMAESGLANADMVEGYLDGCDRSTPEPSSNRSASYRHGFANGRDDLNGRPRDAAINLREKALDAMKEDLNV